MPKPTQLYIEVEKIISEVNGSDTNMANRLQEIVDHIKTFPQEAEEDEKNVQFILEAIKSAGAEFVAKSKTI